MESVIKKPIIIHNFCRIENPRLGLQQGVRLNLYPNKLSSSIINGGGRSFCTYKPRQFPTIRASSNSTDTSSSSSITDEEEETSEVLFTETFPLKRTQMLEGKIFVRLDKEKGGKNWQLTVGCNLPGKWILHWGVSYIDNHNVRSTTDWDQPPPEMRPPGSVAIKDYAIETPLKKSSSAVEGQTLYELQIGFKCNSQIAALSFVLKDGDTGFWCQHKGRDFKVPLADYIQEDGNTVVAKKGFSIWPGITFNPISSLLTRSEGSPTKGKKNSGKSEDAKKLSRRSEGFYEECAILKEVHVQNILTVSVRKSPEKDKNLVKIETDIPGDVVVHWGVCKDDTKVWKVPDGPYPPDTNIFKKKALQTLLQPKDNECGSWGLFTLDTEHRGLLFVMKLNDNPWLNHMGSDFYIPLSSESSLSTETGQGETEGQLKQDLPGSPGFKESKSSLVGTVEKTVDSNEAAESESESKLRLAGTADKPVDPNEAIAYTDRIINEIRNLVTGISSEKGRKTKSKALHVSILQEIEKLAAEAYSIFRSAGPKFLEEEVDLNADALKPPAELCSGTGSGYEILCQGFNWESHKSGKWYMELNEKAPELSSLGFTILWLPPPTESVSPEGYMPKDLYNLDSRYGSTEELKALVKKFHEVGIKVLGDVVLNHRCGHYQNQNGVWNIFGGRLDWDDRAVVADDPHFQGRGNKSSGDNFHAAPNIDHSQEFVRKDLKEWLSWLRKEIGYDGWRLDFVRGFWGGYVKDYLDASEPYFAVGEYWDSLSYTYDEMDPNQDAHRQRIIDWINATNGAAGAFDVTTKGILHTALEQCEYWRLSDEKGKPPGVVGWWPSRAVTFIENHDTGSTQGHWRFPGGKEMQGYAYILTHPGTPAVFHDHIFSHYKSEISALISLRHRMKLHCRSVVEIAKAEKDVYAAIVDEKVAMKIGPGHYEPPSDAGNWVLALKGRHYKVWEAS